MPLLPTSWQTSLDDAALSTSGISTLDTSSDATHSKEEVSPNSEGSSSHSPPKAGMEVGRGTTEAGSEETGGSRVADSSGCPAEEQEVEEATDSVKNTSAEAISEQNQEGSESLAKNSRKQSQEISEDQNNGCEGSADSVVKEVETVNSDLSHTKDSITDDSGEQSQEDLKDSSQGSSSDFDNQNKEAKENITAMETETSNHKSPETTDDSTQQTASQETTSDMTHNTSNLQGRKTTAPVGERPKQRHISSSGSSSSSDEDKLAETLTITETPEISGTGGHLTSEGDESLESSPEPHVCPPPHYLTANNGMLLSKCMGKER